MLTTGVPTVLAHAEQAATGHGLSLGGLVVLAAALLVGAALLARRTHPRLSAASLGSVLAGAAHAVAAPDHFRSEALFGALFAAVAVAQVGGAALLRFRATPALVTLTASANLLLVAVWAVSRTVGLPFGPGAGVPEPVGALDALAVAGQLMAVIACSFDSEPAATRPVALEPAPQRFHIGHEPIGFR